MDDLYRRYGASTETGSDARVGFPGYLSTEGGYLLSETSLGSNPALGSTDLRGISSDLLKRDITPLRPGAYGSEDTGRVGGHSESAYGLLPSGASLRSLSSIGGHPEPTYGVVSSGLPAEANVMGYSAPKEDPNLMGQRRDVALGINSGIPDVTIERPGSLRNVDGHSVHLRDSNILHVDGLPTDCTRREVGHLFRPFIGYKDIKVVHKEARHSGDKARVLCFVEFTDPKCSLTAMEALQGYKFDDKKPESPALKIQFAHFPFHLPSDRDEQQGIGPKH